MIFEGKSNKIVVAVVFYDRIKNFILWHKLVDKLEKNDSVEYRFIHNAKNEIESTQWEKISKRFNLANVSYIKRKNVGLDIGTFQDVALESLVGFDNDFKYLIWFTDDCLPTSSYIVKHFLEPFEDSETICSCFELANEIRPHIRTTGFCLKKETVNSLVFPSNVVTTKEQCYAFEHGQNSMYMQIKNKGKIVTLGDTLFYNEDSKKCKFIGLDSLKEELNRLIYGSYNYFSPLVNVFSTAYDRYPQIVSSIISQNYKNIVLNLMHDSEPTVALQTVFEKYSEIFDSFSPMDFYYGHFLKRVENYGHPLRKHFLETHNIFASDYLIITNEDNYFSPYFIQKGVELLEKHPEKVCAYSNKMVHNYKLDEPHTWKTKRALVDGHHVDGYGVIDCRIEKGYIDIACCIFRTGVALSVEWNDFSHSSDWNYIETIENIFGLDNFIPITGCHVVHN